MDGDNIRQRAEPVQEKKLVIGPIPPLRFLTRQELDTAAWNACVAASAQQIVYGYSWYLDAVLPQPDWKWAGVVRIDQRGQYQAVMPVPLRRKFVAGIAYDWVVHQPLFCQMLAVFSPDTIDPTLFLAAVRQRYRYGSVLCMRSEHDPLPDFDIVRQRATHVLDLSVGYETISRNYTCDRQLNLRRATNFGWTTLNSTDPEPLLTLFRNHHADSIDGGVGDWAYGILRNLTRALQARGLAMLRYALHNDRIEAGALFVQDGSRIIYLFNAASEGGRRGNARTFLIDQVVRANADKPLLFDFESPRKDSVVAFYRSFGAVEEPFREVRWSRLTLVERYARVLMKRLIR